MIDTSFPFEGDHQRFTLRRADSHRWGRLGEWAQMHPGTALLGGFVVVLIMLAILIRILISANSSLSKMPTLDCTLGQGAPLVGCFGTNANAYRASIAFADRYGLPIQAKLIGTTESTTLKAVDAMKFAGAATDVVGVSVLMSPGDKVIVPINSDASYDISRAAYVHNGKVVQPIFKH